MFKIIEIENFKAFGELQKIPLKPITLIFGPNSSGKSSIIHSLIYLHHALKTENLDVVNTKKGGSSVDLGGLEQLVHKHNLNNRISWGAEIDSEVFKNNGFNFGEPGYRPIFNNAAVIFDEKTKITLRLSIGVELDDQDKPLKGEKPKIYSYEIFAGGKEFLKFSLRPDGKFKLDLVNNENLLTKRVIRFISQSRFRPSDPSLEQDLEELIPILRFDTNSFLPYSVTEDLDIDTSRGRKMYFVSFFNAFTKFLKDYLEEELENLEYLGPLRSYPPRIIETAEDNDPNFKAGGGFAWKRVLEDQKLRQKVNKWLSSGENLQTPYELGVRNLHTIDKLDQYYKKNIIKVLENTFLEDHEIQPDIWSEAEGALLDIKEFEEEIAVRKELVITDKRTKTEVTHRDIGIGISQVLPVLVSAMGNKNKTIAIEQPEIHLHPAIQAELGDIFIEGAKDNGNCFLLETHSEHLILRLLRRIRESSDNDLKSESKFSNEDLMVLYVEPDKNGSKVYEIPIDEEGDFLKPWPQGFFAERSKELFS
ncbi:MAG: DUF3696 domain-containing protein [Balneolaceae bacterium]